jgi:hypothetical protein
MKNWMYIWQNTGLTYIAHSEHRYYATIEREVPAQRYPASARYADLEDMTDDCYSVSMLISGRCGRITSLSVRKWRCLSRMAMVEEFLAFVGDNLGGKLEK